MKKINNVRLKFGREVHKAIDDMLLCKRKLWDPTWGDQVVSTPITCERCAAVVLKLNMP